MYRLIMNRGGTRLHKILYLIAAIFLIIIVMPMILIYSCDVSEHKIEYEQNIKDSLNIRVYSHETKKVQEIEIEEYVKGVVASEMPASFELDALKAQAVAARTKAIYQKIKYGSEGHPNHPGAEVCDDVHCQVYRSREKLEEIKSSSWMKDYWPKIERAVEETRGLVLTYDGMLIDPLYHSTSGGRTENSEDVFATMAPYLRSVESPYESHSKHLQVKQTIPIDTFISKFNSLYKDSGLTRNNIASAIEIQERNEGGSIAKIKVGNTVVNGRNIREIFGLESADFDVNISGDNIIFTTRGYGHGVGMSQYGADGMAKEGYHFIDILKHYYKGVEVEEYNGN